MDKDLGEACGKLAGQTPQFEKTPDFIGDVARFTIAAFNDKIVEPGVKPKAEIIELLVKMIQEEVNTELLGNLAKLQLGEYSIELMAKIMDDIADSIWVCLQAAIILNLPIATHWKEVNKANDSKFVPRDGNYPEIQPINSVLCNAQDGSDRLVFLNMNGDKVVKPTNFIPPNEYSVLYRNWILYYLIAKPNLQVPPGGDFLLTKLVDKNAEDFYPVPEQTK